MDVAGDITAQEADARPLAGAHTIAELARHIVAWRDEVRARVTGKEPSVPAAGDWPAAPAGGWAETVAELDRSFRHLRDAITQVDAARWEQLVGPSREAGLGTGVTTAVM